MSAAPHFASPYWRRYAYNDFDGPARTAMPVACTMRHHGRRCATAWNIATAAHRRPMALPTCGAGARAVGQHRHRNHHRHAAQAVQGLHTSSGAPRAWGGTMIEHSAGWQGPRPTTSIAKHDNGHGTTRGCNIITVGSGINDIWELNTQKDSTARHKKRDSERKQACAHAHDTPAHAISAAPLMLRDSLIPCEPSGS